MGWIITFLSNVTNHSPLSIDELYVNVKAEEFKKDLNKDITNKTENLSNEASSTQELKYNAYQFEKLVISYIKNGEAEELRDFFSAIPNYLAGNMSEDGLRQLKDMGICGATVASRAAISGGLDYATAFLMSDLYIQKIEMIKEERSLDVLRNEMMIDFVEAVRKIRYRIKENNIKM